MKRKIGWEKVGEMVVAIGQPLKKSEFEQTAKFDKACRIARTLSPIFSVGKLSDPSANQSPKRTNNKLTQDKSP